MRRKYDIKYTRIVTPTSRLPCIAACTHIAIAARSNDNAVHTRTLIRIRRGIISAAETKICLPTFKEWLTEMGNSSSMHKPNKLWQKVTLYTVRPERFPRQALFHQLPIQCAYSSACVDFFLFYTPYPEKRFSFLVLLSTFIFDNAC